MAGQELPRSPFGTLTLRPNPLRTNSLKVVLIPQRRLEELLEGHACALGAEIRRGHAATGFHDDGGPVAVDVASDGGTYTADAGFLVGCDGGAQLRAPPPRRRMSGCPGRDQGRRRHRIRSCTVRWPPKDPRSGIARARIPGTGAVHAGLRAGPALTWPWGHTARHGQRRRAW
ncbi:FAD-dependent monooxygenase [Specibacter cremeus]|uniref:FAD-dependent monooxygenase n=1 Tax=Specibacter cremeus TaxID=1629051 RepID=UPI000F79430E